MKCVQIDVSLDDRSAMTRGKASPPVAKRNVLGDRHSHRNGMVGKTRQTGQRGARTQDPERRCVYLCFPDWRLSDNLGAQRDDAGRLDSLPIDSRSEIPLGLERPM